MGIQVHQKYKIVRAHKVKGVSQISKDLVILNSIEPIQLNHDFKHIFQAGHYNVHYSSIPGRVLYNSNNYVF